MAGLQLQLDTEREEKRLLQEQLQEAEVSNMKNVSVILVDSSFSLQGVHVSNHKMSESHNNYYTSPLNFSHSYWLKLIT